jgi:fused signal recognition particle receptor
MLKFFSRKAKPISNTETESLEPAVPSIDEPTTQQPKQSLFGRLKERLHRTRKNFSEGIAALILGKKQIDDELLEEIETQLLIADLGVDATEMLIKKLTAQVSRKELDNPSALYEALKHELTAMLQPCEKPLRIERTQTPYVILMVGANGNGKTTTIGKLAKHYQAQGLSVMLAAGDTFRAAAIEQLAVWGERNAVPVIAQHTGADSASVLFDALKSAQAKQVDVLIADTAGRLHNKNHLMEELEKIIKVLKKCDPSAPHEIMLVIDAATGQNALKQAQTFHSMIGITGITLTKLDGTAKGGIIFSIAHNLKIPIRFIGVGEGIDDLKSFETQPFVDALFSQNSESEHTDDYI